MVYYKLKEMLETALSDVVEGGEITSKNLETICYLVKTIKNVDTIEAMERSSNADHSFDSRPSRNYNYDGWDYREGMSNARRRDSMGRYSRDDKNEIIAEMHELKNRVKDENVKHKIETLIEEMR